MYYIKCYGRLKWKCIYLETIVVIVSFNTLTRNFLILNSYTFLHIAHEILLVFRNKDLYLIITQKLTFMKSGGFQVKSTQNLIKSDVSPKTLQFGGGCMEGAITPDFMKSKVIAPLLHSSNWIVFVETSDFIRFWVDFTWNPADFMWNRKTTCKEL